VEFGKFPARRLGFTTAAVASVSAFGFSLAGIAGLDGDVQRAEREAVRAEQPVRSPDGPAGSEGQRRDEDCPWRKRQRRDRTRS
jgi:hypothetical protein